MLQFIKPILTLFSISFILVCELTSITMLRVCLFVSYMNLGIISPFPVSISVYCAIMVSSMLSVEISSGIFIVFSLGFRGLCMCVPILSPSLSLMQFVRVSVS